MWTDSLGFFVEYNVKGAGNGSPRADSLARGTPEAVIGFGNCYPSGDHNYSPAFAYAYTKTTVVTLLKV